MRYLGGKNSSGSYQRIISEIPLHDVYIELFAGSAPVYRFMRPSMRSYLIDKNLFSMMDLKSLCGTETYLLCMSAIDFLKMYPFTGSEFIYADPPYLFSARRSGSKSLYSHEFGEDYQHVQLLSMLQELPCYVAISGYWSSLYSSMLPGWRHISWISQTRKGVATEYLWMNYSTPAILHDPRFIGSNFTQRQRLRRLYGFERPSMPAHRFSMLDETGRKG